MTDMGATGKCRLCLQEKELRASHLLPKSLYRLIRMARGHQEQGLVVITREIVTHTDSQVWAHLLCNSCEGKFAKAESWALRHCNRGSGAFRLLDMVEALPVLSEINGTKLVAAAGVPEFDAELLGYFAMSVFWRSSVHNWMSHRTSIKIELGPYEDPLRGYLLGDGPLPDGMFLHVEVIEKRNPLQLASTPAVRNKGRFRYFDFRIPGLRFRLYVGKAVPDSIMATCILRAKEQFLFIRNTEDVRPLHKLMDTARLSKRMIREEHGRVCGIRDKNQIAINKRERAIGDRTA